MLQVKQIIDQLADPLKPQDRDNYDEAKTTLRYNLKSPAELSYFVEDMLAEPFIDQTEASYDDFWILCKAINAFRKQHSGIAPQSSRLPDLNSTTKQYQKLKIAYKLKHEEDVQDMAKIVAQITGPKKVIPIDYIDNFIENILVLRYVKYRPYYAEFEKPLPIEDIYSNACYKWLIGIKAVNWFILQNKRYPGPNDVDSLQKTLNNIRNQFYSSIPEIEKEVAQEMCRYEDCKLHVMGAFFGGVIAEEAVKLLIHKFYPMNNTFIHNGIQCESQTLEQ